MDLASAALHCGRIDRTRAAQETLDGGVAGCPLQTHQRGARVRAANQRRGGMMPGWPWLTTGQRGRRWLPAANRDNALTVSRIQREGADARADQELSFGPAQRRP
jgi:hypothetical protein